MEKQDEELGQQVEAIEKALREAQVRLHSLKGIPGYIQDARNDTLYRVGQAILELRRVRHLAQEWECAQRKQGEGKEKDDTGGV
jgi:hypothetical protein